jgi:hypothetical protein
MEVIGLLLALATLRSSETAPSTHWIVTWVCHRAGVDKTEKRKISETAWN